MKLELTRSEVELLKVALESASEYANVRAYEHLEAGRVGLAGGMRKVKADIDNLMNAIVEQTGGLLD